MPLPECTLLEAGTGGERTQCPQDMGTKDPELERVTANSLLGATVRLVGGYTPRTGRWSRTRISYMIFGQTSSDGLVLGWSHLAGSNAAEVIQAIAVRLPDLARQAWPDHWKELQTKEGSNAVVRRFRGLTKQPGDMDWFLAGWSALSPLGPVQNVYAETWFKDHGAPVVSWMQANGLREARTFALGARLRNTSGDKLNDLKRSVASLGERAGVEEVLSGYKQDRVQKLNSWPEFQGEIEKWPEPSDLQWDTRYPSISVPLMLLRLKEKWPWVLGAGALVAAGYLFFTNRRKRSKRKKR